MKKLKEVKIEFTYFCYRTIADLSNAKNNRWVNFHWTPLTYHTNSNIIMIEPSPKIGGGREKKGILKYYFQLVQFQIHFFFKRKYKQQIIFAIIDANKFEKSIVKRYSILLYMYTVTIFFFFFFFFLHVSKTSVSISFRDTSHLFAPASNKNRAPSCGVYFF